MAGNLACRDIAHITCGEVMPVPREACICASKNDFLGCHDTLAACKVVSLCCFLIQGAPPMFRRPPMFLASSRLPRKLIPMFGAHFRILCLIMDLRPSWINWCVRYMYMYSKYIGMSMYVFIYECACVQVSHNVCTYAYNRRYIKLDKCMYVCTSIYMYACIYLYMFICI